MRRCNRCGVTKTLEDFPRHRAMPLGRGYFCRDCARAAHRRWQASPEGAAHRDSYNADRRVPKRTGVCACGRVFVGRADRRRCRRGCWSSISPERRLWSNLRVLAKRRGLDLDRPYDSVGAWAIGLRERWAYYGGRCWLCREPAATWDHVKPIAAGGHPTLLANLRPACSPCNTSKGARWPRRSHA